jgi:plasmid maintenance system killer protein
VKSKTTPGFWSRYGQLPVEIQRLADRCYQMWLDNPHHPSLRFKKLGGRERLYSARVGDHYRAVADFDGEAFVWVWIGSHEEYNKLLRR